MYLSMKSVGEKDEIAGYNETRRFRSSLQRRYNTSMVRKATSGSRNLLRGRGSVLLQRITRLATSLVPSLMPRASYRGSCGNQTCVERKHAVSCARSERRLKSYGSNARHPRSIKNLITREPGLSFYFILVRV